MPAIVPSFSRLAVKLTGNREYTDASTRVLTQDRDGAVPRDGVRARPPRTSPPRSEALQRLIDERRWRISFPVECASPPPTTCWLSTASGRASGYIAVHRYWRESPTDYFEAAERIMLEHGGRPHWGKMHTLDAEVLRDRYPHFEDFTALRERLDPARMFTNRYLDRVLGE